MKKLVALFMASMMVFATVPAMAEEAGFEELQVGPEEDNEQDVGSDGINEGILHVAAVYFQPVEMEPVAESGLALEDADIHIEADIHYNENDLGFGVGDWAPYMTVDYKVIGSDGEVAAEGTFMTMNASDGPHYGANIALPNADTYTLEVTIHSPEENGYLLHVDSETGVTGRFWEEPIVVTWENWEYLPLEY